VKPRWIATIALLALAALLTAYLAAALAAATRDDPLAASLADQGRAVSVAAGSPSAALRLDPGTPAAVLLVSPPGPLPGEEQALADFARGGGQVWILAPDGAALAPVFGEMPKTLPGHVYTSAGQAAATSFEGAPLTQAGLLALELPAGWAPAMLVGAESFRDTDGNGRLTTGEPAGPYVLAAKYQIGSGYVGLVALDRGQAPSPSLVAALTQAFPPGRVLVLEPPAAAWTRPALASAHALAWLGSGSAWGIALATLVLLAGLALVAVRPRPAEQEARDPHARARAWLERMRETNATYHARLVVEEELGES
jgi:hypothetical protein